MQFQCVKNLARNASKQQLRVLRATLPIRCFASTPSIDQLTDSEIINKIEKKELSIHKLESLLSDPVRALSIRRQIVFQKEQQEIVNEIPSNHWDSTPFFSRVAVVSVL